MKKIILAIFCTAMVFSFIDTRMIVVHAHDDCECEEVHISKFTNDESYEPRAIICICGTETILTTTYGAWKYQYDVPCTHHDNGYDMIFIRSVTKAYVCPSCGNERPISSSQETKTECHGYD